MISLAIIYLAIYQALTEIIKYFKLSFQS